MNELSPQAQHYILTEEIHNLIDDMVFYQEKPNSEDDMNLSLKEQYILKKEELEKFLDRHPQFKI